MEPIVIEYKYSRIKYVFHSDRLVAIKKSMLAKNKEKVIGELKYDEIKEITYNPKFGLKDFFRGGDLIYKYECFTISYRERGVLIMRVSKDDFEKIKDLFGIPIKMI